MSTLAEPTASPSAPLTVYYDGGCPICLREIGFYQRRSGARSLAWVDISRCGSGQLGPGLDRQAASRRLHVRVHDGTLLCGAAAFVAIWRQLPAFSWLAAVASPRPVQWVLDRAYRAFLKIRPLWRSTPVKCALLPENVMADLRTDHAGEVGAVQIYRGILAVAKDPALRRFAEHHQATEIKHLQLIENWISFGDRSRLLPLWRISGWLTGAIPALVSPHAVYATIAAVETFVDRHYRAQIDRLSGAQQLTELRDVLEACRRDEVAHRDEAFESMDAEPSALLRLWTRLVASGSAAAVRLSRSV